MLTRGARIKHSLQRQLNRWQAFLLTPRHRLSGASFSQELPTRFSLLSQSSLIVSLEKGSSTGPTQFFVLPDLSFSNVLLRILLSGLFCSRLCSVRFGRCPYLDD